MKERFTLQNFYTQMYVIILCNTICNTILNSERKRFGQYYHGVGKCVRVGWIYNNFDFMHIVARRF